MGLDDKQINNYTYFAGLEDYSHIYTSWYINEPSIAGLSPQRAFRSNIENHRRDR